MSDAKQQPLGLRETQGVTTVDKYEFEPIKGYPMLTWKGKRPFTSTQYYPTQLKEVHGPDMDGWRNKIYWGDNLQVMSHLLKEYRGKIQLIYIDPPFDSKAEYKKKVTLRGKYNLASSDNSAFEEKQYSDIWSNDEYLQFIYERIILMREMLSENGSLIFHCDPHKNHHIRCLLDEVYGQGSAMGGEGPGFRNEIIWCYAGGGAPKSFYQSKHDILYWYSKSSEWIFNKQYRPYSEGTYRTGFKSKGMESSLNPEGATLMDWWNDCPKILSYNAAENMQYPTQKPESLLTRIIKGHTREGDLVLDCFMGSGTTQAVAMKLGRRFIGADINLGAIQITTKRLIGVAEELQAQNQQSKLPLEGEAPVVIYPGFEVYNVNHYDVFRNPVEAKDLLLEALEVQRIEQGALFDGEKDGRVVKIMPVNRIATRADLSELISGFDYKAFERRQTERPKDPVEKVTLVCMGHEPDLAAVLENEVKPFKLDVQVVDILRDKQELQFKRDSEAWITLDGGWLTVEKFYPMNLLQKLSLQQENVEDWRELVESVMIDWNYDGAILTPALVDIPDKNELVKGKYQIPNDAGTIRVKITDLLSESLEIEVEHG